MKTSESIKEISPALCKAQAEIKTAVKDATNPHFKSKYADLASVIEACKGALNKHGITLLQPVRSFFQGEGAELIVIVETRLVHTSGEWLGDELGIPAPKRDAQGFGSAVTYGRRYGLQSLVGIPAEDDDGNAASKPVSKPIPANIEGAEIYAAMSAEERDYLRSHAGALIALHAKNGDMGAYIAEARFDNEEKLALWTQLPSDVRSAIKRQMKPTAAELASQP